jgi:hypothetical protein
MVGGSMGTVASGYDPIFMYVGIGSHDQVYFALHLLALLLLPNDHARHWYRSFERFRMNPHVACYSIPLRGADSAHGF